VTAEQLKLVMLLPPQYELPASRARDRQTAAVLVLAK
jgi:hypothetical protein